MLTNVPFAIPRKRLYETPSLLAFFHPKPSHAFHVVFLPRKPVRSLAEMEPSDPFLGDLVVSVQWLVREYQLPSYRLVVNGGEYQECPHLHCHLISDADTQGLRQEYKK